MRVSVLGWGGWGEAGAAGDVCHVSSSTSEFACPNCSSSSRLVALVLMGVTHRKGIDFGGGERLTGVHRVMDDPTKAITGKRNFILFLVLLFVSLLPLQLSRPPFPPVVFSLDTVGKLSGCLSLKIGRVMTRGCAHMAHPSRQERRIIRGKNYCGGPQPAEPLAQALLAVRVRSSKPKTTLPVDAG